MRKATFVAVLLGILVIATGCTLLVWSQPNDKGAVADVVVRGPSIGDVANALGIIKRNGEFKLRHKTTTQALQMDAYKDGKLAKRLGLGKMTRSEAKLIEGMFSVQVVDLDYLPLKGSKPEHYRVVSEFVQSPSATGTTNDLPKSVFDFSKMSGSGTFPPEAQTKLTVPLFWMLANTKEIMQPGTVDELVLYSKKLKGDLLVVSLVLE